MSLGLGSESAATLMWDAIATAQGKPGSRLRVVLIGTLAPALGGTGGRR